MSSLIKKVFTVTVYSYSWTFRSNNSWDVDEGTTTEHSNQTDAIMECCETIACHLKQSEYLGSTYKITADDVANLLCSRQNIKKNDKTIKLEQYTIQVKGLMSSVKIRLEDFPNQ